jgi:hypothetical protein
MKNNPSFRLLLAAGVLLVLGGARPATADSSHARIVRLSTTQGDVRFARSAGNDSLTDPNVVWEGAALNLPIRQGYVLGTGSGRAAVEFEFGNSAAYLDENAVLEFQDLSLHDGVRSTRLVLRQGTAAFIVAREGGEYFSVTAGEVTAKIEEGANFRMDVYDDGVTIGVKKGRVTVTTKSQTAVLEGGHSISVRNGETANPQVQALPAWDDFDQWVSETQASATAAYSSSMQYVSSPNYSYGFADLYTYGNWFACPGFFNSFCWQPFGVGIHWRPFHHGHFCHDRRFGLVWVSHERWGWLPYHHGGWLFSPARGWMWSPGLRGQKGLGAWQPFTGTWVRSGGQMGVVPLHPMDASGRMPLNLMHGVITPPGVQSALMVPGAEGAGHNWRLMKSPPAEAIRLEQTASAPPERVSRTVAAQGGGMRFVSVGRDSTIVFDPVERKFVNADPAMVRSGDARGGVGDMHGNLTDTNHRSAAGLPPGAVIGRGSRIQGSPVGAAGPGRMPGNSAAPVRPPAASRSYSPPSPPRAAPAPHTSAPHTSSGTSSHSSSSSSAHTSSSHTSSSSGGRSH